MVGQKWRKWALFFFLLGDMAYCQEIGLWGLVFYSQDDKTTDESVLLNESTRLRLGQGKTNFRKEFFQLGLDSCLEQGVCFGARFLGENTYQENSYKVGGSFPYQASLKYTLEETFLGPSIGYKNDWFYLGGVILASYSYKVSYIFETTEESILSPIPLNMPKTKVSGEMLQLALFFGEKVKFCWMSQYESLYRETSTLQNSGQIDSYESLESIKIGRLNTYFGFYMGI